MKTETPRTDAAAYGWELEAVPVETARQLERELNEAVEWRDKWKACVEQATLVHEEISRVMGVQCLPCQMPRFVAERLAAVSNS
jgi:hypothetical protein